LGQIDFLVNNLMSLLAAFFFVYLGVFWENLEVRIVVANGGLLFFEKKKKE